MTMMVGVSPRSMLLCVRRWRSIAFRYKGFHSTLSSSLADDETKKKNESHKRITRTLYRQLLRWCDATDANIPLSRSVIPPIRLSPPQIHAESLVSLLSRNKNTTSVWQNALVTESGITIPSVGSSETARELIRQVFRMNATTTSSQDKKKQLTLAFEWTRALNELTERVEELAVDRENHTDRKGVSFRIGQIVKHTTAGWRGVVLGWNKRGGDESSKASSLTQKSYPDEENENGTIVYDVALDWGDATLLHSGTQLSGLKNVYQSDLAPVDDPDLMRIKSATEEYFRRFDPRLGCFVPDAMLEYVYPNDRPNSWEEEDYQNPSNAAATAITQGIRSLAEHLRRILLGYTSAPEARNLHLVSEYIEKLTNLANGDVVTTEDRMKHNTEKECAQTLVKWQLQKFVELAVEIEDTLWTRRKTLEHDLPIQFSLGDVVQHKKYGFRGVVVAWDPEPAYDVSRWDGLQHIDKPEEYPFYHVVPDRNDVLVAFGGERPWRYVCEANLEVCPKENRDLDLDLDQEWKIDFADGKYSYVPSDELKLRHGEQLEDDGLTEMCLREMKNEINYIFSLIRQRESVKSEADADVCSIVDRISMDNLFLILKNADNSDMASVLTDAFKEIWKGHKNGDIRYKFDTGVNYLLTGKTDKALSIFGEVVDEDPTFAEAWNKAATCEFMIGNLDASMAAAQKTLEIAPDHFQALNGLGLVYNEKRDLMHARDNFRKSIELDPWSPVAPRLSVCLDTLKRWKKTSLHNGDEEDSSGTPEWKNPITGQ